MGQHVVVHVDGGTVVYGVAQTLSENSLTCVWGQAKQEEAGLSSREAVDGLEQMIRRKTLTIVVLVVVRVNSFIALLALTLPCQP